MKKITLLLLGLFISLGYIVAQVDTSSVDLLSDLETTSDTTVPLLPNKMVFTQRIFWGQHGLMRNFSSFKLTPEERQRELRLRSTMFGIHQVLGTITLGTMLAQAYVGTRLYNGHNNLMDLHEGLAIATDIGYFTTASLALFAPPKAIDEHKGYSSIKIHRALAIIHFTSMVATNVLAGFVEDNPSLRPYHRAAAYTAVASYTLAFLIIKF